MTTFGFAPGTSSRSSAQGSSRRSVIGVEELLRLRLLGDGRVLAEARRADAGALLVAADAAAVLAGHALDPEALVADRHAELVDRLEVDRDVRRDLGEPAAVGVDVGLAEDRGAFVHREAEHRDARGALAREALDDADLHRLLERLGERDALSPNLRALDRVRRGSSS